MELKNVCNKCYTPETRGGYSRNPESPKPEWIINRVNKFFEANITEFVNRAVTKLVKSGAIDFTQYDNDERILDMIVSKVIAQDFADEIHLQKKHLKEYKNLSLFS